MTESAPGETRQGQGAYARLLAEIGSGVLRPGDRLRETEIAARLGISRTPVREAIRQLEAEGLVAHVPRVGAAVRRLDYAEVMELYEMRVVLEGTAARLAARAASDIEIADLAEINAEMAGAVEEAARAYALNRQFHAALTQAAKNRYLARSMEGLERTLMILGPSTLRRAARAREAVEEHEAVLAALRNRDQDGAEAAMRAHVEAAQRSRLRQLRAGD
ncbi:putative HTH-type transcriptional regulator YdfH [Pseudoruegeria aquimaris]|uniref:Putative HTH-type transcriptional regulator YdfH n=1 Tax=Pseudoruegeria aquimaris TaxID=393663 RepID=A0A1Y5SIU0_9RHOB|nr:GntR family transcriptional regulator [Pseudoruegeria aquimaris]SLN41474.1 putative HTH-type transcriptional regulator YdfH [Pseudoruegeria aquimaris]